MLKFICFCQLDLNTPYSLGPIVFENTENSIPKPRIFESKKPKPVQEQSISENSNENIDLNISSNNLNSSIDPNSILIENQTLSEVYPTFNCNFDCFLF